MKKTALYLVSPTEKPTMVINWHILIYFFLRHIEYNCMSATFSGSSNFPLLSNWSENPRWLQHHQDILANGLSDKSRRERASKRTDCLPLKVSRQEKQTDEERRGERVLLYLMSYTDQTCSRVRDVTSQKTRCVCQP